MLFSSTDYPHPIAASYHLDSMNRGRIPVESTQHSLHFHSDGSLSSLYHRFLGLASDASSSEIALAVSIRRKEVESLLDKFAQMGYFG